MTHALHVDHHRKSRIFIITKFWLKFIYLESGTQKQNVTTAIDLAISQEIVDQDVDPDLAQMIVVGTLAQDLQEMIEDVMTVAMVVGDHQIATDVTATIDVMTAEIWDAMIAVVIAQTAVVIAQTVVGIVQIAKVMTEMSGEQSTMIEGQEVKAMIGTEEDVTVQDAEVLMIVMLIEEGLHPETQVINLPFYLDTDCQFELGVSLTKVLLWIHLIILGPRNKREDDKQKLADDDAKEYESKENDEREVNKQNPEPTGNDDGACAEQEVWVFNSRDTAACKITLLNLSSLEHSIFNSCTHYKKSVSKNMHHILISLWIRESNRDIKNSEIWVAQHCCN